MNRPVRAALLALAFAATPACASLYETPPAERRAALTMEQRAYALLGAYAIVLEEAADVVREPAIPASVKRALADAERTATPVAEALHAALAAHVRARDAASAEALRAAVETAEPPLRRFETLMRSSR